MAIFVLGAAIAVDQHYYYGRHTDAARAILRAIRHSFGW